MVHKLKVTDDPNELLNEIQCAQFIKFSARALQAWRHKGGGPPYVKISSRAIRYRKKDLIAWAESHLRLSTSDNGSER